jgi:hypothetical protein
MTAIILLTLFVGLPILVGHIIYFGSKDRPQRGRQAPWVREKIASHRTGNKQQAGC